MKTNKQIVLNKRPAAFAHAWKDKVTIYCPKPGHGWKREHANPQPVTAHYNDVLGWGRTHAEAWASAARAVKGKRARRPETRRQHRTLVQTRAQEARDRGRHRRELATKVGTFLLNELEIVEMVNFNDYRRLTPRWVIRLYLNRRPG